jgi:hypothetical protein
LNPFHWLDPESLAEHQTALAALFDALAESSRVAGQRAAFARERLEQLRAQRSATGLDR